MLKTASRDGKALISVIPVAERGNLSLPVEIGNK
jgi:hypothetical protein